MSNLILLQLPSFTGKGKASSKLQEIFKSGAKSDVKIKYNNDRVFALHKSYLRQESEYFKDLFKSQKDEYDIKMKFQSANFEQMISCIYGYSYHVKREDILLYFELCKQLKINSLLEIIRADIRSYIQEYNLFRILDVFYQQNERELYDLAVKQLEEKSYNQLKDNNRDAVLIDDIAAFRNLIKLHDRFKQKYKTDISYKDINRIIKEYCYLHQKDRPEELYQEMRRELINKDLLTATEFGQIFEMNETRLFNERIVRDTSAERRKFAQTQLLPSQLNTSVANNMRMGSSMLTSPNIEDMKYQNTYMKKKLKEQEKETAIWIAEFENLKKQRIEDEKVRAECQSINKQFKSIVDIESNNLHKLELRINKLEDDITIKDKLLQKQSQEIIKLKEQLQKLKQNPALLKQEPQVDDMLVESTIIPHDYLKGLKKPKVKEESKTKEQQQPIQECTRLEFDVSPLTLTKKHYSKLLNIIDEDSFSVYKLNLLYRATEMGTRRENFFSKVSNHSNLLVLIKSDKTVFGGYISIEISSQDSQYLSDSSSYVFNVVEGRKFKSKSDQSLYISEEYLICFGEDIMIFTNCLIQGGTSSWPSTFEGDKTLAPGWLCGSGATHSFVIEELEVYEIGSAELEMTM